jgi:predicted RNA-binding Zn ribbon-like protein
MNPQRHEWTPQDFVAGELCLEFTNTVGDYSKTRDVERLTDWAALVDWAAAAGAVETTEAEVLRKIGRREPAAARRSLQALLNFRKLLFSVLSALAAGETLVQEDLDEVETIVRNALSAAHLKKKNQTFGWAVPSREISINTPLVRIALSALGLLQNGDLARLRECQRCSWLFVDRSKSHGRRWCRADACGNRARVARHYRTRAL